MSHQTRLHLLIPALVLSFAYEATAVAPAVPSEGSIAFTRTTLSNVFGTANAYHLKWKDNAVDEEGFEIQMRPGATGTFNTMERIGPNTDTVNLQETIISSIGLPPGTPVQFRIVAWKLNGSTLESNFLTIPFTVPNTGGKQPFAAPSAVTVTIPADNDGRINVSWQDDSDEEKFFQVLYRELPSTADTAIGFVPFGTTSLAVSNQTRLVHNQVYNYPLISRSVFVPGKTYSISIRGVSGNTPTNSAYSGNFIMPSLRGPTDLSATTQGEDSVVLRWKDNSNNETAYEIESRPITGGIPPAFASLGTVGENITSASIPLSQLATAEFRVRAIFRPTGAVLSPSADSPFTPTTVQQSTTVFAAPTGLIATTSGMERSVALTWQDKSSSEFGFNIYCRESGSTTAHVFCRAVRDDVTKINVNSFSASNDAAGVPVFTDLSLGVPYEFIVRAVGANEAIFSSDSNTATATPQQGFTGRMYQPIKVGVPFSHTITTSNSVALTAITATPASLPPGLTINESTGVLSGTPTQAGVFNTALTATYSAGPAANSILVLRVQAAVTPPTVATPISSLTLGIGEPYIIPLADKFIDADSETAVRWETSKGNIDFLLYPSLAPLAVTNFMAYVNAGDYKDVFFHRHVSNFVIQAGGFKAINSVQSVASRPSPINEPGITNTLWTIAAAKVGARNSIATLTNLSQVARDESFGYIGNPDSATTDIFINLGDNSSNLDNQNGGFTSYGRVSDSTQATVTAIRALPVGNYGGALSSMPVNVTGSTAPSSPTFNQLVKIIKASSIPPLAYTIDNLTPGIATVEVVNNTLKLTGVTPGSRSVTVTASDLDGRSVTQTFTINIDAGYQTPTITTQPISQLITAGANATISVVATGTGLTYKWRKNDVILPSRTSSSLELTSVQAIDAANYDVIVSNANTTLTSTKATISLRTAATLTGTLPSKLVEVGQPLEILAPLTGSPEPVCVWKRGTSIIKGQTTRRFYLPVAKLSDAGLYTVTAVNLAGASAPGSGGIATVIVINKATLIQVAKAGTNVKLTAPVAGPGLTYQWKKGSTDITNNTARFTGNQGAVLSISATIGGTPPAGDSGDYTCLIGGLPSGLVASTTGIIRYAVADKPVLLPMTGDKLPPTAYVGLPFEYSIPRDTAVTKTPASFKITGLPKGLVFDAVSGLISGIPIQVGSFTLTATASNPSGSSSSVKGTLKVLPLLNGATGSFVAQVNTSALNLNHGGRLTLTITDNSLFSANLQMGAELSKAAGALRYIGTSNTTGRGIYQSVVSFPRKNRSALTLVMNVAEGSGELNGVISDGIISVNVSGYRLFWNYKHNPGPVAGVASISSQPPATKYSYRLNVGLNPETSRIGQLDTPQGSGYLALTVNNDGLATLAGRLADDTSITGSTLLSSEGELYYFQMLNSNTASIAGRLSLVVRNSSTLITNQSQPERVIGSLRWLKLSQAASERRYQPGFAATALQVLGSPYYAPGTNKTVWGIPDLTDNLTISFARGGLTTNPGVTARLNALNTVTPPSNAANVGMKITPSTGFFTGTFELKDGTVIRKVSYNGLIIPAMADSSINELPYNAPSGAGYFLLPELLPSTSRSSIRSGSVALSTPLSITFTTQPITQSVATGGTRTLTVSATPSSGLAAVSYEWRKNNVTLTNGTGITGASTASLALTTVDSSDAGSYTCIARSSVLEAISNPAILTITP